MNGPIRIFVAAVMVSATIVALAFPAQAAGPVFRLEGGGCYFPEETLKMAVYVTPAAADNLGDLYVVLKTPDGDYYSYKRWNQPNVLTPFIPNWTAVRLNAYTVKVPLSTLPTSTVGKYTFLMGMMKPGTRDLMSNVAKMKFYIKKAGQVPSACQCTGSQWSLYTDTFYSNPSSQVEIYMDGMVPMSLTGSDVSGSVSGSGPMLYRNVYAAAECVVDVSGDWTSEVDGTYGNDEFSLTQTIIPDVVTGTITCSGVTQPITLPSPGPPPDGASKAHVLPMSNGYTTCSSIKLPGWTGDTCKTLTCP